MTDVILFFPMRTVFGGDGRDVEKTQACWVFKGNKVNENRSREPKTKSSLLLKPSLS